MNLEEHLAVPYVLEAYSVPGPDGTWLRRVEYPELGCSAESESIFDAIEALERSRRRFLTERYERGEHIPVPRPPLSV